MQLSVRFCAEILEGFRRLRARLRHGPERVGNILRIEVQHIPVRLCAETLEDIRHLRACLGHGLILRVPMPPNRSKPKENDTTGIDASGHLGAPVHSHGFSRRERSSTVRADTERDQSETRAGPERDQSGARALSRTRAGPEPVLSGPEQRIAVLEDPNSTPNAPKVPHVHRSANNPHRSPLLGKRAKCENRIARSMRTSTGSDWSYLDFTFVEGYDLW